MKKIQKRILNKIWGKFKLNRKKLKNSYVLQHSIINKSCFKKVAYLRENVAGINSVSGCQSFKSI